MALIHQIFQRCKLPPDEFWGKPEGTQKFMLASMMLELEVENQTVKDAKKGG